jgi:hypothetical protein
VCIWSITTRRHVRVVQLHSAALLSLQFHHNDSILISQARDGTVKLWSKSEIFTSELLVHSSAELATRAVLHHCTIEAHRGLVPLKIVLTNSHTFGRCSALSHRALSERVLVMSPGDDPSEVSVWEAAMPDVDATATPSSDTVVTLPSWTIVPEDKIGMARSMAAVQPIINAWALGLIEVLMHVRHVHGYTHV